MSEKNIELSSNVLFSKLYNHIVSISKEIKKANIPDPRIYFNHDKRTTTLVLYEDGQKVVTTVKCNEDTFYSKEWGMIQVMAKYLFKGKVKNWNEWATKQVIYDEL